ncbi:MAG: NADH-quinone oxidoreductase subunit M, partial [Dehalococcoidia bacterium]
AYPLATALSAFGIVLAAGYILWMIQRTMFGPSMPRWADLPDAKPVDVAAMLVLIVPIFVVGVYPRIITDLFDAGLLPIVQAFGG